MLTGRCRRPDGGLDPEPERRAAVVPQRDRLEPQAGRGQERTIVVVADQPRLLQLAGSPGRRPASARCPSWQWSDYAAARQLGERRPCRRDRRGCGSGPPPRSATSSRRRSRAARRWPWARCPRRSAARLRAANQGRISSRSAGEHGELNGHDWLPHRTSLVSDQHRSSVITITSHSQASRRRAAHGRAHVM